MKRTMVRLVPLAALLIAAAACAPFVRTPGGATELVTLPSGEVCGYAGEGATLAFDGQRLSWTCEVAPTGPRGLFGEPTVVGETELFWRLGTTIRRADAAGFELARLEAVEARVARVTLATGETCAFAGEGATLTVEGRRVNYTCDGDVVLLGPFGSDERGLTATKGTLERRDDAFVLAGRLRTVRVATVELAPEVVAEAPKAEVAHAPLMGTTWALERIAFDDGTSLTPDDPARYTLVLGVDGSAALLADCNRGAGTFELDGELLAFGGFATTRVLCPPGSIDQDYLAQLGAVVSYRFDDGALVLSTPMDASLLHFQPLD